MSDATLVNWTLRPHSWIKLDFAEGTLISRYILLQQSKQSFCLLRAEIDALEISDLDLRFGLLLQGAKCEEEIPDINAHLDAVGIVLAVRGVVRKLHVGLGRNSHTERVYQQRSFRWLDRNCQRLLICVARAYRLALGKHGPWCHSLLKIKGLSHAGPLLWEVPDGVKSAVHLMFSGKTRSRASYL